MAFRSRTRALPAMLLLVAAAGCHRHPAGAIWAEHAWVRLAPVPGRPAAAYLTVHGGAEAGQLISVDTPRAGSSELHETLRRMDAGAAPVMSMDRVDGIDLPAGGTVTLAPEGYHAMLFGVAPGVKPGDRVPLTLRFARGAPMAIEAKAVGAGDPAPY
jgi:periplasmic copper chaperone A